MKKGLGSSGYTILEIMIVLAVSSAILLSGLLLVGDQQTKAELTNSVNETKAMVDGVINTVSSGYYQSRGDFTCRAIGGHPVLTGVASSLGTNTDCVFLGKAIQFGVSGDATQAFVYPLIGLHYAGGVCCTEPSDFSESQPTGLAPNSSFNNAGGVPSTAIEKNTLSYGLKVYKVKYNNTTQSSFMIAFASDYAGLDTDSNLNSGSRSIRLYAIKNVTLADGPVAAVDAIKDVNFDPATDATVCFSGYPNKYVILKIGGSTNGRQLSTEAKVQDISSAPPECS